MVIGIVPIFQAMTAWFVVIREHFGWSNTQLSIAFSLSRAEGSIMGPISGYLIDKLGSRRMVAIGLSIAGGGFVLMSQMNSLWQFYLSFVVMSGGMGLGCWMPMMTVLNNWFVRHRSTAMALAMEGSLLGGMALVPLIAFAIDPDVPGRPGWRITGLSIGLFLVAVAFPVSLLIKNAPEPYGQRPDGAALAGFARATARSGDSDNEPSYTWQQALRTKSFWLITMGHACSTTVIGTVTVHAGPMLYEQGISLQTVGWVVGAYTGVSAVFTVVGGYVGDRMPIRTALFAFSSVQSGAVAALMFAESQPMAFLFAVLMGIGFGGRHPLTTSIRGVYFGRKAFASITGISMIPMNVLMLAAPLFVGILADARADGYFWSMGVIGAVSLLGSSLFLFLGNPTPERGAQQGNEAQLSGRSG